MSHTIKITRLVDLCMFLVCKNLSQLLTVENITASKHIISPSILRTVHLYRLYWLYWDSMFIQVILVILGTVLFVQVILGTVYLYRLYWGQCVCTSDVRYA